MYAVRTIVRLSVSQICCTPVLFSIAIPTLTYDELAFEAIYNCMYVDEDLDSDSVQREPLSELLPIVVLYYIRWLAAAILSLQGTQK